MDQKADIFNMEKSYILNHSWQDLFLNARKKIHAF